MRIITDIKRAVVRALQPYRVVAHLAPGWCMTHKAWSYADALAWAACYPRSDGVAIYTRRGRFLGGRRAAVHQVQP